MRRMMWLVCLAGCVRAEVAMHDTVAPATLGARDAIGEVEAPSHTVVAAYAGSVYQRQWNTGQSWGKEWANTPLLDAAAAQAIQGSARRAITGLRIDVKAFCVAGSYESVSAEVHGDVVEVAP